MEPGLNPRSVSSQGPRSNQQGCLDEYYPLRELGQSLVSGSLGFLICKQGPMTLPRELSIRVFDQVRKLPGTQHPLEPGK